MQILGAITGSGALIGLGVSSVIPQAGSILGITIGTFVGFLVALLINFSVEVSENLTYVN